MALSVPSNGRVNVSTVRMATGFDIFISDVITLDGSGEAVVPHGFQKTASRTADGLVGDTPVAAWFTPLDGNDESGITLTVDATNVNISGGVSGGKLLVIALR